MYYRDKLSYRDKKDPQRKEQTKKMMTYGVLNNHLKRINVGTSSRV